MTLTSSLPHAAPPRDGRQSDRALAICVGARRLLASHGFATLTEMTLASGRRADILAVAEGGEIWIVEIKSSVVDYRTDAKWPEYRDYCDRFLFAVDPGFPTEIIPGEAGLILADRFGAALTRPAPEHRLPPPRRRAVTLRFARQAASRLHALTDPLGAAGLAD